MPLVCGLVQELGCCQKSSHMHVVTQDVHDGLSETFDVLHAFRACVGEAYFLLYWQGVHVCAEEDGGAVVIALLCPPRREHRCRL